VPSLHTDMRPHLGHLKACLMFSSMSATSTRVLRPYLGPNLPALLVFLPFALPSTMSIPPVFP
jgi:hypothetical protein